MNKFIPIILILILILILVPTKHTIESLPSRPLYKTPFPSNWTSPTQGYISYENFPYTKVCPSLLSNIPTLCKTKKDCGEFEICSPANAGGDKSTCLCMFPNLCQYSGVC